jgi:N-acetylglucosaminyldiphosphoundecaprenol N-acetyl-beta-D-mannosaminyltransferase
MMKSQKMSGEIHKNDGNYWEMWKVPLFSRGIDGVLKIVEEVWEGNKKNYWIATVNPEFMMAARKDAKFKALLLKTNLNVVDGIGLVWAKQIHPSDIDLSLIGDPPLTRRVKRLLKSFKIGIEILQGKHKEDLVTGVDLMDGLCRLAEVEGKTVYFFGGWEDRAERTAEYFLKKYPRLRVAGCRAEDFDFKTETDVLFVARGMKKQEEWIDQNLGKLRTKVVLGVGRSFDYYSGELKRAPEWVRKMGLEWLYSLLREPKRWRRQLELPKFIWEVIFGL